MHYDEDKIASAMSSLNSSPSKKSDDDLYIPSER